LSEELKKKKNFHALGRRGRIQIMNFLDLRKEEGGGGVLK